MLGVATRVKGNGRRKPTLLTTSWHYMHRLFGQFRRPFGSHRAWQYHGTAEAALDQLAKEERLSEIAKAMRRRDTGPDAVEERGMLCRETRPAAGETAALRPAVPV